MEDTAVLSSFDKYTTFSFGGKTLTFRTCDGLEELSENAWNKLWKRSCVKSIRFPEGRIFEDIATTYKIYKGINCLSSVKAEKFHYEQREGSLSRQKTMKNLSDFWLSHYERFMDLYDRVDDERIKRLQLYCGCCTYMGILL